MNRRVSSVAALVLAAIAPSAVPTLGAQPSERAPRLLSAPDIPAPRFSYVASGSVRVVVNPDGTVDSALTRPWTSGPDTAFNRGALAAIRAWRFEPGIRDGSPIRTTLLLRIESDWRNDSIPSRIAWRYVSAAAAESLIGTWIAERPLPPLTAERIDSVHAAVLRQLVRMQVVAPAFARTYCIVTPTGDSATHQRAMRYAVKIVPTIHLHPLAEFGCERTVGPLRIVLGAVHLTENGRAVLYPAGDFLPHYPPGTGGRSWRTWRARCVATVPETGSPSVDVECEVAPGLMLDDNRIDTTRREPGWSPGLRASDEARSWPRRSPSPGFNR